MSLSVDELKAMKKSIERIELAIVGDENAGIEGLVKQVKRHEKILNVAQRAAWIFTGAGLIIAFIYKLIVK